MVPISPVWKLLHHLSLYKVFSHFWQHIILNITGIETSKADGLTSHQKGKGESCRDAFLTVLVWLQSSCFRTKIICLDPDVAVYNKTRIKTDTWNIKVRCFENKNNSPYASFYCYSLSVKSLQLFASERCEMHRVRVGPE